MNKPMQGSYKESDCLFLMQEVQVKFETAEQRESKVQSGIVHYSEKVGNESPPTEEYSNLFYEMMEKHKGRLATEVMSLAKKIVSNRSTYGTVDNPIVLLSLARAGTPIGVLLKRALDKLQVSSVHYSISIIRDKGIDEAALDYIVQNYDDGAAVFIDGWTAKGVITKELHQAVEKYNALKGTNIPKELFVISDIGGTADVTATYDDYTMPSALMNSTVSGLLSRSVLNDEILATGGFHGCVVYRHLAEHDLSNWFIDEIDKLMDVHSVCDDVVVSKEERQLVTKKFMNTIMTEYSVSNINRVKPGIAEATRIMLRRTPDLLMVKDMQHVDTAHLVQIAIEKSIEIVVIEDMPFGACSIIRDL